MTIRKSNSAALLSLWEYNSIEEASPTARFFCHNIDSGNADFWAVYDGDEIIGELYAFKNMEDKDFANGTDTAYLCAFRIEKEYRGKGHGSSLMNTVLEDLKTLGFTRVTIGVGMDEEDNISMYRHMGFTTKIKDCFEDPCARDDNMRPKKDEGFWLLAKTL